MDCVCLPKCPFFHDRMAHMPEMAELFKQNYCKGDNSPCARFLVYRTLGPGLVPEDLWPNDTAAAQAHIASHRAG